MATKTTKQSTNTNAELKAQEAAFAEKTEALKEALNASVKPSTMRFDTSSPYSDGVAALIPYTKRDGIYGDISAALVASYKEDTAIRGNTNGRLDRIAGMGKRLDAQDKSVGFARAAVLAAGKKSIETALRNAQSLIETAETANEKAIAKEAKKRVPVFGEWANSVLPNTPQSTLSRLASVGEMFVNPSMKEEISLDGLADKALDDAENVNTVIKTARFIMETELSVYNLAELTVMSPAVVAALIQCGKISKSTTQKEIRALVSVFKADKKNGGFLDNDAVYKEIKSNPEIGDALVAWDVWDAEKYPYRGTENGENQSTNSENPEQTDNKETATDNKEVKPVEINSVLILSTNGETLSGVCHTTVISEMKSRGFVKLSSLKRVKGDNSHMTRELFYNEKSDNYAVVKSAAIPPIVYNRVVSAIVDAELSALAKTPEYESMTVKELNAKRAELEKSAMVTADSYPLTEWIAKI